MTLPCSAEISQSTISVGVATTFKEKRDIYRLRYQIYVEEMAMQFTSVDHHHKLLYDEMDKWGVLLYAKYGSEIVGTMRINIGKAEEFPEDLAKFLELDRFKRFYGKNDIQKFSYTSKLMVSPYYRNSTVLHLLTAKGYEIYCEHQSQFNFGVCNFHLLPLYEQFGHRRYRESFTAPGYDGVLMPFVLLVDDVQHIRAVRSPYYRFARKRGQLDEQVSEWFQDEFPRAQEIVNSQLVGEEELWPILENYLGQQPHLGISVLEGLSPAEAQKFLHACGIFISCRPGEQITSCGHACHTLKILLSGKLAAAPFFTYNPDTINPGQCFGPVGLIEQPDYNEDIFAASEAEILVLSRLSFQKFRHAHPDIAAKVIRNLESYSGGELVAVDTVGQATA